MKNIILCLILSIAVKSEVLIPAENVSLKDFEAFIKTTEYLPYTDFKIQSFKDAPDFSEKILNLADLWLAKESSYLQTNKDIRQLQNERFLKNNERRLLFNIFEKKIQQKNTEESQKYYVSQACWVFANDKEIKNDFSQFEDYCQLKKVSTFEIRKKFPEYKYLVTDGNVIVLKADTSIFYNDVPQKIEILSDKKQSVSYYGTWDSFLKKPPTSGSSIVKGNSAQFESEDLENIESYEIYFSDKKIMSSVKKSFLNKTMDFIADNKYEIISGTIIVLAGAYYMRDKTIKFENSNSLNLQTTFSF